MRNRGFLEVLAEQIRQARLGEPQLLEYEEGDSFESAVAVFRAGPLELKVLHDRGHEFLELRRADAVRDYVDFDALSVVLGWAKVEDIIRATTSSADEPPIGPYWRIDDALARLSGNQEKVTRALTPPTLERTLRRIDEVQRALAGDLLE